MPAGLTFNIYGKDISGSKALKDFEGHADTTSKGVSSSFKKAGSVIGGALSAVAIGSFFKDSVQGLQEHQQALAQSEQVIKTTGGAAGLTADQVGALSDKIEAQTGVDGDLVLAGENMLLTFTNIRNEVGKGNDVFDQATQIVTDMSAALGTDMKNQAIQVGKALNDPIKGVSALSKVGVSFTEQQKAQIATMVQSNDTLGAQKVILGELGKEFGGTAAAIETPTDKMMVAFHSLEDQVGEGLLPVFQTGTDLLTNDVIPAFSATTHWLQDNWGWLKIVAIGVGGLWLAWKGYTVVKSAATSIKGAIDTIGKDFATMKAKGSSAMSSLKGNAGLVTAGMIGVGVAIYGVTKIMEDHAHQQQINKQVIDDYTQALEDDSGALDENVRKVVEKNLVDADAYQLALKMGISQKDLTDALLGNAPALERVKSAMDTYGKTSDDAHGDVFRLNEVIGGQIALLGDALQTQSDVNAADGKHVQVLGDQQAALDKTTGSMKDQTSAADKLMASIKKLSGDKIDAAQAELRFKDGLAQATSQVEQNGSSLTANTAKGRVNREWLLDQISSLHDVAQAQLDAGEKTAVVTAKLHDNEDALRKAATAAGLNKDQVHQLIADYGKLPSHVSTSVSAPGLDAAVGQAQSLRDLIGHLASTDVYIGSSVTGDGLIALKGGGRYAQGTGYSPGGVFDVGEYGRERLYLPRGSKMISRSQADSQDRVAGVGAAEFDLSPVVDELRALRRENRDMQQAIAGMRIQMDSRDVGRVMGHDAFLYGRGSG